MQSLKILRSHKRAAFFLPSSLRRVLLPATPSACEGGVLARATGNGEAIWSGSCPITTIATGDGRNGGRRDGNLARDQPKPAEARRPEAAMAVPSSSLRLPEGLVTPQTILPYSVARGGRVAIAGREGWHPSSSYEEEEMGMARKANPRGAAWGIRVWARDVLPIDMKGQGRYFSVSPRAEAAQKPSAISRQSFSGVPGFSCHVRLPRGREPTAIGRSQYSSAADTTSSVSQVISAADGDGRETPSRDGASSRGTGGGADLANTNRSQQRKWSPSMLVLILPCVATFLLGTWQLQRRRWKIDLLERREERLHGEAQPLTEILAAFSSSSSSSSADNLHHHGYGHGDEKEDASMHTREWEPLEYRRVVCQGVFHDERSVFVGPRVRSSMGIPEKGYFLITPLILVDGNQGHEIITDQKLGSADNGGIPSSRISSNGSSSSSSSSSGTRGKVVRTGTVLVNRGWVPATWQDRFASSHSQLERRGRGSPPPDDLPSPSSSSSSIPSSIMSNSSSSSSDGFLSSQQDNDGGPQVFQLTGIVRVSERPSSFVPANLPENGRWFFIDVPAISRACGLPPNTPLLELVSPVAHSSGADVESEDDVDFPIQRSIAEVTKSAVMPRDHINYALTWYTLSAATTYMAWRMLRRSPARRRPGGSLSRGTVPK